MRDPMDPENPYRDQYQDWDYWCYMNARDPQDENAPGLFSGAGEPNFFYADIGVDPQGFMVPFEPYFRQRMEWSIGNYDPSNTVDCAASLTCAGPIDGRLREKWIKLNSKIRAAYVLPMPLWLAEEPPAAAKYLPDGSFAVLGELGDGDASPPKSVATWWRPESSNMTWSHYDADGELLKAGQPGEDWWQLFIADYREALGIAPDAKVTSWEYNGMITVYDFEKQEYCGAITYDGTVLPGKWYEQAPTYDPRAFATLSGVEIPLVYAAQQYVKPVEPHLSSS